MIIVVERNVPRRVRSTRHDVLYHWAIGPQVVERLWMLLSDNSPEPSLDSR
jgi:hypothetical protein